MFATNLLDGERWQLQSQNKGTSPGKSDALPNKRDSSLEDKNANSGSEENRAVTVHLLQTVRLPPRQVRYVRGRVRSKEHCCSRQEMFHFPVRVFRWRTQLPKLMTESVLW